MARPTNVPPHGAHVEFTKVPAGSYASVGEVYRVSLPGVLKYGSDVWLQRVNGESSTTDRAWSYEKAEWSIVG